MDVPHPRHRAGLGVGILRTGLGRLVVLGPGGKRLVYAVAGGNRAAALHGGDRKAGQLPRTDGAAGHRRLLLCLLGTFTVRSGVLVSVHAFASDPSRGLFILVLLIVAIGGSLLLYALKGGRVRARVEHTLWSRESFLLGNNILLMAAMLVVLLGTLLPLVHKELGLGSISIGEPFFNTMFTALMAPFALLLGLGPLIRWRRDDVAVQIKRLIIALLATLSLSLALPWLLQDRITAMAVIGLMMALWVLIFALMEVHERATHRHGFWRGLRTLTRSQWGWCSATLAWR